MKFKGNLSNNLTLKSDKKQLNMLVIRGGSRNYSEGCSNLRLRNQGCCYAQTLNPLLIGHNEMKVCHKLKSLDALILFSNFLLQFDQISELCVARFECKSISFKQ